MKDLASSGLDGQVGIFFVGYMDRLREDQLTLIWLIGDKLAKLITFYVAERYPSFADAKNQN